MPIAFYTYIRRIYTICKYIFVNNILKWDWALLHIFKRFPVLLYNSHNLTSLICLHAVCSIWPIKWILSSATTPGNNGNEGVLHILQISKTEVSPSCHIQETHLGVEFYFSAEMQSVYSTTPANWAKNQTKPNQCVAGSTTLGKKLLN